MFKPTFFTGNPFSTNFADVSNTQTAETNSSLKKTYLLFVRSFSQLETRIQCVSSSTAGATVVAKLVPFIPGCDCRLCLHVTPFVVTDGASCMFPNTGSVRIFTCLSMKLVMSINVALLLTSHAPVLHLSLGNFCMMVNILADMSSSCRYCTSSTALQQPLRKNLEEQMQPAVHCQTAVTKL